MIEGKVTTDLEAIIGITVRGTGGRELAVHAIIDTGFNAYLTLPPSSIVNLGLTYHSVVAAVLADGSRVALRKYEATVDWDGGERDCLVLAADGAPLLGMAMLRDHRLEMEIEPMGRVTLQRQSDSA